jgi:tetratricopeptide (TPR) repeat protein
MANRGEITKNKAQRAQEAAAIDETLQRAMSAIQGQQPDYAAKLAQDILKRNSGHPNALHIYGYALLMQDRASEAIAPLEKAFRTLRDPAIETQLAIALRKAGRTEDALTRLQRAAKQVPVFPAAVHELGYLLNSLGRTDEAIEVIKSGMEAVPRLPDLPILLGWIFHARNDGTNARAAFARALVSAPNHPDAHYGMGLVLMDAAQYQPAADHFRQALANDPADQQARLYLGACLLEMGEAGAATCFRLVTRGGPNFYGKALKVLSSSSRGRFWVQPSAAAQFFRGERN